MDYLVTASEMKQADENTIQYFGIPQLVLMEKAAMSAKNEILRKWPEIFQKTAYILIAAGNGNNGGDGAALARLFYLHGCHVTVLVSGETEKYSEALQKQMEILEKYAKLCHRKKYFLQNEGSLEITDEGSWNKEKAERYDVVVDALFGVGLSREVTGINREKIDWLNQLSGRKVALDVPSGISVEDGRALGCCFRADLTVTFGFMKRGMLLYPGREMCGLIQIADIGIAEESFLNGYPAGITIRKEKRAVYGLFLPRLSDSHKGSYGKVLLIAGSAHMPGAALLSGEALLRSGAGMLQIVSPMENRELILMKLPEAMYRVLDDTVKWESLLNWSDVVVMGPGIGQDDRAEQCMEEVLHQLTKRAESSEKRIPLILDADALNLLASSENLLTKIKKYTSLYGDVILSPHIAEFSRLLHCSVEELQHDRMGKIKEYCEETGVILVSKDAATVVGYCRENGEFRYYINQTGNSGMATAGSGDVLSGILGSSTALMAVEYQDRYGIDSKRDASFLAAVRAVYLHGLAGDKAAENYGRASMKAGDIIKELPGLLSEL